MLTLCQQTDVSVCVRACVGLSEMLRAAACACLLPIGNSPGLARGQRVPDEKKKNRISVCTAQRAVHVAEEIRANSESDPAVEE